MWMYNLKSIGADFRAIAAVKKVNGERGDKERQHETAGLPLRPTYVPYRAEEEEIIKPGTAQCCLVILFRSLLPSKIFSLLMSSCPAQEKVLLHESLSCLILES
jgi:hypothetical protein